MPALSPTMSHGNIGIWRKQVGDKLEPGDVICEIETDKATVDFEFQDDAFLGRILEGNGSQNVPVGALIGLVVDDAADVGGVKDWNPSTSEVATPSLTDDAITALPLEESSSNVDSHQRIPSIKFRYG